jgi:multidrug resistance efflux pump
MEIKRDRILHSEPVREIMGTPPRNLITWGTSIMAVLFVMFLLAAWFIEYPDIIPAQIEITSRRPPVTITARADGKISELMVADKDEIPAGTILAVIESAAYYGDIVELESSLSNTSITQNTNPELLPQLKRLGELQQPFSHFIQSYNRLHNYITNDYLGNRINALKDEINASRQYIEALRLKEKLLLSDQELEIKRFRRDSLLMISGTISQAEYEKSLQALLAGKMVLQQMRLDILSDLINLNRKEQEVQDLALKRDEEVQQLILIAEGARSELSGALDIWKNRFLLVSPVAGQVTFLRFWSRDQVVSAGDGIMTVVPAEQGEFIGRATLAMQKSGKVRAGMPVSIKLSGYPYLEFGLVRGAVNSISLVPDDNMYSVEIGLPEGLTTNYGKELPYNQNMSGIAEIMTDNMNLLQKIVYPFKYLLTKNRVIETVPVQ